MSNRLLRVLIALDILAFALLTLGGSKRNETISSAAWSMERNGRLLGKVFRPTIDWLFSPLERNHCQLAWETEQGFPKAL